ncbi:MAG: ABC transporter ATP-binding protein [Atribacterota bacterium]|nr:ABC transporter ATP-binding protein [Atribacterota bacterium]MDD4895735.1 ABC transporter ATP-binding protein [Atribacterota bacterium]MDD5636967.1 ABC transporter ATP-binding protein [Atribacterota bacterium]
MIKLLKNLRPYWLSIAGIILFVFLQAISELFLPTLMSDIVDVGVVNGDINFILKIGGRMLLIAFIAMMASIYGSYLASRVSIGFTRDLRTKVFTKVESFSLEEFNKIGTASLIVRTTNDITQMQQLTVTLFRMFLRAPLLFVGGIIMAISKNTELALLLVVILPILAVIIFFVAKKSMNLFKSMQMKIDKLNLVLREYLTGIRVIRAFNREEYEKKRFNNSNFELTDTARKVNTLMVLLMPLMTLILNLTIVAIIWLGSVRIEYGSMQVGDLMAFVQYASQIMFSLIMFSMMFVMIPRASISAVRINEVLDVEPKIKDPVVLEQNILVTHNAGSLQNVIPAKNRKGYLKFDKVCFCYQDAKEYAIKDISFQANPGEVTAIIGSTGSGKSTLINLIPRFYDVSKGSISIDDTDIRDITQERLHEMIGLVPQKVILFTGTIAENINFGNNNIPHEEIKRVTEIAQAAEFINRMPEGYNSLIAQGGTNLSGGEKQRLSIARALAKHPDIFIFDDSFSAIDFKTEARLREELKDELKDKTVLIIAQRVTTVMSAEQIVVLDKGEIVGIGKHHDLIKSCSVYKEIVASQLSTEEIYE